MRYVQKGEEPASLIQYKKSAHAYFDGYPDKDDVRETLLKEQGFLCGYCMRRLNAVSDVKIEHVVPQSELKRDERKALDYRIMLGVCYGNEGMGHGRKSLTCDAHRGDDDIYVTPYEIHNIEQITYDSEGRITSEDENIRKTVEETLNLNYDGPDAYLVQNRRDALNECKAKLRDMQENGTWKKSNLRKILNHYMNQDKDGKCIPYSGIVIDYIKRKLDKAE